MYAMWVGGKVVLSVSNDSRIDVGCTVSNAFEMSADRQ